MSMRFLFLFFICFFVCLVHEPTAIFPQPLEIAHPSTRVGISSEWDGTSQPKNFHDAVMSRSKVMVVK